MKAIQILVIEDDYIVARTIERSLKGPQYCVTLASRGDKGLQIARQILPDLVILDIIMPFMDGYAVCRAMRNDRDLESIPILFLTAKTNAQDKIAGFLAGGDDYLCKPFNIDELILRIQAILRRTLPLSDMELTSVTGCLEVGDYSLNTRSFELQTPLRGKVRLTPMQFDLLYHLMTHPEEPFTTTRLLDEVWDYPTGRGSPDLVRVHIKTLRERIENNPRAPSFICTVPGRGYMVSCASLGGAI